MVCQLVVLLSLCGEASSRDVTSCGCQRLGNPAIEASPRQAAGNVLPDGRASQHRKDDNFLDIRSLTPQPAKHCRQAEPTGTALAYAIQAVDLGRCLLLTPPFFCLKIFILRTALWSRLSQPDSERNDVAMTRTMSLLGTCLLLFLALAALTSCASIPSREFQQEVGPPIAFQELLENGEAYKGRKVILGGHILETKNEPQAALISVLQAPLDSRNMPKAQDLSEGRFLVRVQEFMDPEIYSKGRKLTVGGTVSEVLEQPLGNRLYKYPVIEAVEFHLWPKERRYVRPYEPIYPYFWYHPWHRYPYVPPPWWAW
jgi:outer membrane lipoprotein